MRVITVTPTCSANGSMGDRRLSLRVGEYGVKSSHASSVACSSQFSGGVGRSIIAMITDSATSI